MDERASHWELIRVLAKPSPQTLLALADPTYCFPRVFAHKQVHSSGMLENFFPIQRNHFDVILIQ